MLIEALANERVMYTGNGQGISMGFDSKLDRALYGAGGGAQIFTCGVTPLSVSRTFMPYWQGYRACIPLRTTRLSVALSDTLEGAPLVARTGPAVTPMVFDATTLSRNGGAMHLPELNWSYREPIISIEGQPAIVMNLDLRAPAINPMRAGQLAESQVLQALGSTGKVIFKPTLADIDSVLFKVVVGEVKYTPSGAPVFTIFDGSVPGGLIEVKFGSSPLVSTYQLRLQTYAALSEFGKPLTIHTSRPLSPSFRNWLNRWGVSVTSIP
jgi:hypothetical protein